MPYWRVLDADEMNTGDAGMFLLSENLIGNNPGGSYGNIYFNQDLMKGNAWQKSDAQAWCGDFLTNVFSGQEQAAIAGTTKSDGAKTYTDTEYSCTFDYGASNNILSGDPVFFLSAEEADSSAYGFTNNASRTAKYESSNAPWWLLVGAALCSNLFNTVRGSTIAYFFNDVISQDAHLNLGPLSFVFYAGLFLSIGEVCNMVGVALAVPFSKALGKKTTYVISLIALIVLSISFFYVPVTAYWMMLVLQIVISIFTGIISPLVWSMYADVADFAEDRDGSSSTGLIFSSGSMAQKFGGAFGGAAVMWMLAGFGYNPDAAVQTASAVNGLKILMSWIPAAVAALSLIVMFFYPLTTGKMEEIQDSLSLKRNIEL